MKVFLKVIAWTGFGIISLGALISFSDWFLGRGGLDLVHPFAMILWLVGTPLLLIGGFVAKPRYFWLASVIVGLLFTISFIPVMAELPSEIRHGEFAARVQDGTAIGFLLQFVVIPVLPGLFGICEGILLMRTEYKSKLEQ
jgi:hypothetical protein